MTASNFSIPSRRTAPALLLVGALCAATGCSRLNASHAGDVRPIALPVSVSSISTIYGIQLDLRGSAAVRDRWVYVDIPTGVARTYQGRASAWDLVVRAGIATCSGPGQGRLIAEGRAGRVAPLVGLTQDAPELDTIPRTFAAPLHLEVGIPPGTDLTRSWVTLDVSWPVEASIASYTLTASGGIAETASDPQSADVPRSKPKDADDLQAMEILHAPPPNVNCS